MEHFIKEEQQLHDEATGIKLLEAYRFWSKKRGLFNLLVGLSGAWSVLAFAYHFTRDDLAGILAWGLFANGLYSFGYELDSYVICKNRSSLSIKRYRVLLFWLGTVAYMLVTALATFAFYTKGQI